MLVLVETPAGYAIFKLLDESKLSHIDDLYREFNTPEGAASVVNLQNFIKFENITEALDATTAAIEGKLSKKLKKALKKHVCKKIQEQLLVCDAKLGSAIKEKFNLQCVSNSHVQELIRCIRSQMDSLLTGISKKDMTAMTLGLSHSLARFKMKFSLDKIDDTMIVQAQGILDDVDKELNIYINRCREWYGWHFPELGKIITDNTLFVKIVKLMGTKDNAANTNLSDILPEDLEEKVKKAAETSMGTEISDDDIINIQLLCDEIISCTDYRTHLTDYLKAKMMMTAPNLTALIGEHIGARLIAHAGSLMNLAKSPASTLQVIGAEKALFWALKSKKNTPKYGVIYHAQLVEKCSSNNKGKMSRMLAGKIALAARVDALSDKMSFELGAEHKIKLENKLRLMEEGNLRKISGSGKSNAKFEKYHGESEVFKYPTAAGRTPDKKSIKRKHSPNEDERAKRIKIKDGSGAEVQIKKNKKIKTKPEEENKETEVPEKKKKKEKSTLEENEGEAEISSSKKKKKKKSLVPEATGENNGAPVQSEKKKKKEYLAPEATEENNEVPEPTSEKKKKKKRQPKMKDD